MATKRKTTKKCILCKEIKDSTENYDRSPTDGRRMQRCKACREKVKEKSKYKKCSACQKMKLKTEFSFFSNGKLKQRCRPCAEIKKPPAWNCTKKKQKVIPPRETVYERKQKEKATAESVLKIAKQQEQEKLKQGKRFVPSGIRAYILSN